MADYSGSFFKGLAGGIQTGLNYGMQASQIRWQIEQKKKLEKEKEKMQEVWTNFSQSAQEIYEKGEVSQETERKLYALMFTLPPELQASANNLLTAVNKNDKAATEKEFANLQMVMEVIEATGGRIDDTALDSLINILTPENQKKIAAVMEAYKSVPEQPEDIWGQAGKLPQGIRPEFLRARGEDIPEAPPEAPKEFAPTAIEQKIAGINNLPIPDDQKLQMKIKVYGGGDTTLEQKISKAYEHGATDEEVKDMIVGGGINITIPPSIGAVKSAAQMFEGAYTEEAWNSALFYNEQAKDKITPPHESSWENRLTAIVKEMSEVLKTYLNEKGKLKNAEYKAKWEEKVDKYTEYVLELQTKFPDVDLGQFPKYIKQGQLPVVGIEYPWSTKLIDTKGW